MRIYSIGGLSLTMSLQVGVPLFICLLLIPSSSLAFLHDPNNSLLRHYGGKVSSSLHGPSSFLEPYSLKSTADISAADGAVGTGSSRLFRRSDDIGRKQISKLSAMLSKAGMIAFIISMCLTLPFALAPPYLLYRLKLISKIRQQQMALASGQFCARWLLRIFPFCTVKAIRSSQHDDDPQPSIWVCNHTSALDVFILLATDLELRGKKKRPIKIVYWKGLEENPITKMLFQQCGFIPVDMKANAAGEDNDYDVKSFKNLLKLTKQAFEEGFDVGILPEGQLNPNPTESLLPCFSGAYTLAKMSRRPIQMMALHGTHQLWHARPDIGMTVTGRDIAVQIYPGGGRRYESPDEFLATFQAVVGSFATTGKDLESEELQAWLDGSKWREDMKKQEQQEEEQAMLQDEEQSKQQAQGPPATSLSS